MNELSLFWLKLDYFLFLWKNDDCFYTVTQIERNWVFATNSNPFTFKTLIIWFYRIYTTLGWKDIKGLENQSLWQKLNLFKNLTKKRQTWKLSRSTWNLVHTYIPPFKLKSWISAYPSELSSLNKKHSKIWTDFPFKPIV